MSLFPGMKLPLPKRPDPLFLALVAGNGSGEGFLMHWQLASKETITDEELANHTQTDEECIQLELDNSLDPIFDDLKDELGVGVNIALFTMHWSPGPYEYPQDGEFVIDLVATKPVDRLGPDADLSFYMLGWTEGLKAMNEWTRRAKETGRPLRDPGEIEKAGAILFPMDEDNDFESATWHQMNT